MIKMRRPVRKGGRRSAERRTAGCGVRRRRKGSVSARGRCGYGARSPRFGIPPDRPWSRGSHRCIPPGASIP